MCGFMGLGMGRGGRRKGVWVNEYQGKVRVRILFDFFLRARER